MKRLGKCILTLSFGCVQVPHVNILGGSYGAQDKHNPYLIVYTQDSTEPYQPVQPTRV